MTTDTAETTGRALHTSPQIAHVAVLLLLGLVSYASFDVVVWMWFSFLGWFFGVPQPIR